MAREIVALANLRGGSVLLGVEDDGSISGIQRPDLELWVMDTVFGRSFPAHPLILPFRGRACVRGRQARRGDHADGGQDCKALRGASKRATAERDRTSVVDSTSRRATREQQARLFESGGLPAFRGVTRFGQWAGRSGPRAIGGLPRAHRGRPHGSSVRHPSGSSA